MSAFTNHIKHLVSMAGYLDRDSATATIRKNIEFKGPNVLILACAIIIASVGLNVNSIPVIIGAMLISPVMGPIMGIGLALGTNDTELLKKSALNFLVMVTISILASTLYFLLSPLKLDNPTELLARTRPSIYDVLIALFGGIAGMLEMSRKDRGTVLSGVAIATALMPPLCTIGFGLSILKAKYIFGAAYLFLINSFFIIFAVYLMAKYLRFPNVAEEDPVRRKKSARLAAIVMVLMLVPSVLTAIEIIRENSFTANAKSFVNANKNIGASYIYDYDISLDGDFKLDIYLAGEKMKAGTKDVLLNSASNYGLRRDQIVMHEEASFVGTEASETIQDLYNYFTGTITELNKTITELQVELSKYKAAELASQTKAPADSTAEIK
jgi:uncharacterized hydrophobic protein (TIGR00271 family)